jgi:hypothetical protein
MKRKLKRAKRKIFGKTFNIWDVVLILSVIPYLFFIYIGKTFESGFGGIYYKVLAPSMTFATIVKWIVNFIRRKQKR